MEPHMLVVEEAVFQLLELLVELMVQVDLVVEELVQHRVEHLVLKIQAVVVVDQIDLLMVDLVEKVLL